MTFDQALDTPGIYVILAETETVIIEVEANAARRCFELQQIDGYPIGGELKRDGWSGNRICAIVGPFARMEPPWKQAFVIQVAQGTKPCYLANDILRVTGWLNSAKRFENHTLAVEAARCLRNIGYASDAVEVRVKSNGSELEVVLFKE